MSGPGISGNRHLGGDSEGGHGTPLGALTIDGGFFSQVFGQQPDPTRTSRPHGDLGPRYSITYVMPGPREDAILRQDFYPYAESGPLTYMAPGQTFWGGQRTHGGWFAAERSLRRKLGLPARRPTSRSSGAHLWRWSGVGGGAVLLGLAIGVVLLRRRPQTRPAAT